jgi:hypothetical protein
MALRRIMARALTAGVLLTAAIASAQSGLPSGSVTIESKSIAIGIGVSWGDGTFLYKDKPHPFSVSGLSVGDLGVSRVTARGEVYNLKKLEDFSGNYVAAEAGATVGGGAGATIMKNQHGVIMKLTDTSQGAQLTLAAKGVDVKLK